MTIYFLKMNHSEMMVFITCKAVKPFFFFAHVLSMCFSGCCHWFCCWFKMCAIYRIAIFLKRQWIMWHIAMLDDTVPFVVIKIPTNKLEMCLETHKMRRRKKKNQNRNNKSTKLDRKMYFCGSILKLIRAM